MTPRILIYDAEIKKAILKKGEEPIPGIEYCGGWKDFGNMGISVVCAWTSWTPGKKHHVFCDDNLDELQALAGQADMIVGFNSKNFDDNLMAAYGITIKTTFDLLEEIWKVVGRFKAGYGLDAMCKANNIPGKTGHGALAPVDWQRGKIGSVIDYCLNDVEMTLALFIVLARDGFLLSPGGNSPIETKLPYDNDDILRAMISGGMINHSSSTITISKKEYGNLKWAETWMRALEDAGIDDWQGIDAARKLMEDDS